ncbi:enoyl-CoA hydratase/isomerase-like protein [Phyllobacterium myrsinacearum]|uniref:enoyl-CoA hydratase/isomerase family protein n=1 Tax=Phyllobacterium myrsinacearum TaxID=28101 RepID=UPI001029DB51|nr:enoyl-CoA hydratase/isomerase family protein [Phyllobacterium myrsinacearum]RZS88767.1 enoyl-CoA hydratase/isomerase-like protein [Phyllobacterium myrsinacearum]
MHPESIIVSIEQAVATATISRALQRNALSNAVVEALTRALDRLDADPAIKVIILTGEGMHFAAGAGVKEMHGLTMADGVARDWSRVL